jgi:hypothetical protein
MPFLNFAITIGVVLLYGLTERWMGEDSKKE